jgi:hypothetical protein
MYIAADKLAKVWEFIREDGDRGGCTVLILVGADVDAMASCKILTSLLQSEMMSYKGNLLSSFPLHFHFISTSPLLPLFIPI